MSESNPMLPPALPPLANEPQRDPRQLPLGELPQEREPILGLTSVIETLLRQPRRVLWQLRQSTQGSLVARLLLLAVLCGLIYGLVMGTFSLGTQLWAAPVKVALGLLLSAFICLPSLYIFSALSGSQARLVEVLGLLAGLLALTSLLLIGFAPVAWVFSQSTQSVAAMGALHLLFGLVGLGFGFRFLRHAFARVQARSRAGLSIWMVIFLFVALQMTTALRPIVGPASTFLPVEKKFFISHWADCLDPKTTTTASDRQ